MSNTISKIICYLGLWFGGLMIGYTMKSSKIESAPIIKSVSESKSDNYYLLRSVSPSIFVAGYAAGHNATKKLLETGTYSYDNVISKMKVDSVEFMSTMNRIYATDSIK